MDSPENIFLAGSVLGLAGALHCAAMCGSIAASATLLFQPASHKERLMVLLMMQAGRATSYAMAGAVAGLAAAGAVGMFEPATALRLLQWASAVSLMWIGLTIAGLLPAFAVVDGRVATLATFAHRALAPLRSSPGLAQFATGLTWGMTPCPTVYGALFTAALTGSAASGALLMAGFGAGTVPAVLASASGLSALTRLKTNPAARTVLGLAIAAFGIATVHLGWIGALPWCAAR